MNEAALAAGLPATARSVVGVDKSRRCIEDAVAGRPHTFQALEAAIRASWSAETAWTPSAWSASAPAAGQCWSTAYVIRRFFGGQIVHAEVLPRTAPRQHHAWNRFADGRNIDLTREQFKADQQFQECSLPEPLIMSVAGAQAELLLRRVSLLLPLVVEAGGAPERMDTL
jgi:hypothetical protein